MTYKSNLREIQPEFLIKFSLNRRKIEIIHQEVPVLYLLTEPIIGANNQLDLDISTGVIQAPRELAVLIMGEFVAKQLRKTRERTGILGELSRLKLMELPQIPEEVELVLWLDVVKTSLCLYLEGKNGQYTANYYPKFQ